MGKMDQSCNQISTTAAPCPYHQALETGMEQQTHPAFSYSIPERSWLEVPKKMAQSSYLKFVGGFYKKL
jgi:hypothetical protein